MQANLAGDLFCRSTQCERKKDGDVENELKNSHLRNGTNKTSNTGEVGGTDSLEKEGSENRDRF